MCGRARPFAAFAGRLAALLSFLAEPYNMFLSFLLSCVPWVLATPVVLRLGQRFPSARWKRISTWGMHLIACAAVGLAYSGWGAALEYLLNPYALSPGPDPFLRIWSAKFYNGLLGDLILYGAILLVSHLLDSRARLARQQTEAARLKEQLSKG